MNRTVIGRSLKRERLVFFVSDFGSSGASATLASTSLRHKERPFDSAQGPFASA
jgi:hypothetical protein